MKVQVQRQKMEINFKYIKIHLTHLISNKMPKIKLLSLELGILLGELEIRN